MMIFKLKTQTIIFLSALLFSPLNFASKLDLSLLEGDAAQEKFSNIATDMYALLAYQDSQPAISKSGIIPFGIEAGFNATQVSLNSKEDLETVGIENDSLIIPRLYTEVNVFSYGLAVTYLPLFDGMNMLGAKLKYSIFKGSAITPAISLNLTYNNLSGSDTLDATVLGANVGISQNFLLGNVYGNLGYSQGTFTPDVSDFTLDEEKKSGVEFTAGVQMSLLSIVKYGLQYSRVSEHNTYTFNFGLAI